MIPIYNYDGDNLISTPKLNEVVDNNGTTLQSYLSCPAIKGVNHRGYCSDAPENTLPAYVLSYYHGFKFVECDIQFTSDGVPVLLHDTTINRTSNGTGNIADLTFAQVREYDFGSWFSADYEGTKIPSLAEFLVLCRNLGLHPYLELKNSAFNATKIKMVTDMVEQYGMKGKVTYIAFTKGYLQEVVANDAMARVGYLSSSVSSSTISDAVSLRTGYNEVFLDSSAYGSSVIALCEAAGLPLEIWTVDNADTIAGLDDYISGVTSNNKNAGFIKLAKTLADNQLPPE